MKSLFLTSSVTKWSFALAAVVFSYFGLPDTKRAYISNGIKDKVISYFNINAVSTFQRKKERFLPDFSNVDAETTYYFNKIVRFSEKRPFHKGPVLRWNKDIKIYASGDISKANKKEMVRVIIALNRLIKPIKITLVQRPEMANSFIYFGAIDAYNKSPLTSKKLNDTYFGHFHIKIFQQEIQQSNIYINTSETSEKRQKHIIREELTQSLGLINDAYDYPESIFYQGYSETKEFTLLDRKLIGLLYQD